MVNTYTVYTTVKNHQMRNVIGRIEGFTVRDMADTFEAAREKKQRGLNYIPSSAIEGFTEKDSAYLLFQELSKTGLWATMVSPSGKILEDNSSQRGEN